MRKIINSVLNRGKRFKKEFRRQIRMLITFSMGFTIAFTWRQTTYDISQTFVRFITDIRDSTALALITSVFVTLLAVLIILLSTHFLRDDPRNH